LTIVRPFVMPVLWPVIIAVALDPAFRWLNRGPDEAIGSTEHAQQNPWLIDENDLRKR
jgi:hypothetical protein